MVPGEVANEDALSRVVGDMRGESEGIDVLGVLPARMGTEMDGSPVSVPCAKKACSFGGLDAMKIDALGGGGGTAQS